MKSRYIILSVFKFKLDINMLLSMILVILFANMHYSFAELSDSNKNIRGDMKLVTNVSKIDSSIINKNLIKFYGLFGMTHISSTNNNYYYLNTGVQAALFNLICLPEIGDISAITQINKPFLEQNIPFGWWIEENKLTDEILNIFKPAQYKFLGDVPGMVLNLDSYEAPLETKLPNIEIKQIKDLDSFRKWSSVLAKSFDFDKDTEELYVETLPRYIKTGDFIAIGAYYNDELVATASIFIDDDRIAGFYNASTLEQYRNKGIATMLHHYRLKTVKNMGIKQVIVQTSPMATSLAKKVGFKQVTNYKIYIHE